jgi:large subunit ribosomal protein L21
MFALVEISGHQFEVKQNDKIQVPLQHGEPGDSLEFSKILLAGEEMNPVIGAPTVPGTVKATILKHGKGDRVLVFKKKRRKGYRKLNGHRQKYSLIEINDIIV